jgi:hydroxymethylpyrimidine pyrophosphatase-like HAD family hydrolase
MHKILVFDLDGTLAPVGLGVTDADVKKLKALEKVGYTIVVCSGKPSYYLCGLMRQIELVAPIMVGENGGTVQFGVSLPPPKYIVHPYSRKAKEQICMMRRLIDEQYGERIWYQPNEIGLTPFPPDEDVFDGIQSIIDSHRDALDELLIYRHADCFDLIPKNINKSNGLALLSGELNVSGSDFIAVGDGSNDVPMFEFADISIGIGNKLKYDTDLRFETVGEALDHILDKKL